MQILASLKTTSPLHIAMPSNARYDPATGSVVYDPEKTPMTSTQTLEIINPAFHAVSVQEPDSQGESAIPDVDAAPVAADAPEKKPPQKPQHTIRVPAIMANNLVGHLRRHAAHHVLAALASKGERVSLPVYSCLQCGAWTGRPDGNDLLYSEYVKARQHPYLGLFGGGPRMIRRAFRAANAMPGLQSLREALHIPHIGQPMPEVRRLTQVAIFRRNDDLADLVNLSQAAQTLKDFESSIKVYQTAVLEGGKKDGGGRASSFTFSSLEFVTPGTAFDLSFDFLDDLTDAQMGLFLLSMDRFAEQDLLGGYTRNGFGRFVIDALHLDGEAIFRDGRLDRQHVTTQSLVQAWHDAAAQMRVEELEYLFRVGGKKRETTDKDGAKTEKKGAMADLERMVSEQQGLGA